MRGSAALAALLLVLPASAQAPAASDATGFALALHRRLASGTNIMTSPYSLRQALGMAYAGAGGATKAEMARVLSAGPDFVAEERELRRSLDAANNEAVLKVANALFVKKGYELLPAFLRVVREDFGAEVFVREFGKAALAELNAWASKATMGRIPSILDKLDELDRAVLLNAVYFKGKWQHAFPKEKTLGGRGAPAGGPYPEFFHPAKGEPFSLSLMSINEKFDYAEGAGYQAVRLPYKGGRLAMIVVLPAESSSLSAFRETLDSGSWRSLRASLAKRSGMVAMPRFKFDKSVSLVPPLSAMGMRLAFDKGSADFSGMSRPRDRAEELFISRVLQKTFVEVNEEGTEAAAVTAVMMTARGAAMHRAPPPFRFVAKRPFFFVIEDLASGAILFLGEVQNPR
ncbi:MAG: serpin family protein [Elusimicrobia bacterium]|nr:serpin family protein [Elusimicrobiota bacterium]